MLIENVLSLTVVSLFSPFLFLLAISLDKQDNVNLKLLVFCLPVCPSIPLFFPVEEERTEDRHDRELS